MGQRVSEREDVGGGGGGVRHPRFCGVRFGGEAVPAVLRFDAALAKHLLPGEEPQRVHMSIKKFMSLPGQASRIADLETFQVVASSQVVASLQRLERFRGL